MAPSSSVYDFGKLRLSFPLTWRLVRLYLGGNILVRSTDRRFIGRILGNSWESPPLWKKNVYRHGKTEAMPVSAETMALLLQDSLQVVDSFLEKMKKESFFLSESSLFPQKTKIRKAIQTIFRYRFHTQLRKRILDYKNRGEDFLQELKQAYALTAFILDRKEYRRISSFFSGKDRHFLLARISTSGSLTIKEDRRLGEILNRLDIHRQNQSSDQIEDLQLRTQKEYRKLLRLADRLA
jgi:hypothetical protein